jgi:hypothetical protein
MTDERMAPPELSGGSQAKTPEPTPLAGFGGVRYEGPRMTGCSWPD